MQHNAPNAALQQCLMDADPLDSMGELARQLKTSPDPQVVRAFARNSGFLVERNPLPVQQSA